MTDHIKRLLAENPTRSFNSIAQMVGCSRERVRQVAQFIGDTRVWSATDRIKTLLTDYPDATLASIATMVGRLPERVQMIAKSIGVPVKNRKGLIVGFKTTLRQLLREAGYYYCGLAIHQGGRVVPLERRASGRHGCKACGVLTQQNYKRKFRRVDAAPGE